VTGGRLPIVSICADTSGDKLPEHIMEQITSTELKQRLDNGEDIQIVDVREDFEAAMGTIPNATHIPLGQVLNRINEIDQSRETVVYCKMGGRSARAIDALQRSGFSGKLINLQGGIIGWSNEVDPSLPKY
jgi:sulfur-carrier protein adenylyltransferase/sulfurtransferase